MHDLPPTIQDPASCQSRAQSRSSHFLPEIQFRAVITRFSIDAVMPLLVFDVLVLV